MPFFFADSHGKSVCIWTFTDRRTWERMMYFLLSNLIITALLFTIIGSAAVLPWPGAGLTIEKVRHSRDVEKWVISLQCPGSVEWFDFQNTEVAYGRVFLKKELCKAVCARGARRRQNALCTLFPYHVVEKTTPARQTFAISANCKQALIHSSEWQVQWQRKDLVDRIARPYLFDKIDMTECTCSGSRRFQFSWSFSRRCEPDLSGK